jgi:hypothetical protein
MEGDEGGESSDLAHPASSDGHSCSVHLDVNEGVFWWGWEELLLWDWTYAWLEDQLFMDVGHWQVGSQTHGSWCAIVFFLFNVFGRWTLGCCFLFASFLGEDKVCSKWGKQYWTKLYSILLVLMVWFTWCHHTIISTNRFVSRYYCFEQE